MTDRPEDRYLRDPVYLSQRIGLVAAIMAASIFGWSAHADPPPAPIPPPEATEIVLGTWHYWRWEVECPTPPCFAWLFKGERALEIERLDLDGNGCIGVTDFSRFIELFGQCKEGQ